MEFAAAQFADVGGRRLAYEEVGPAGPQGSLLLLCGLGAEVGYRAPANKTLLLLLNGALAKRGVRQAAAGAR
jgi:hypothetical protein